MKRKFCWILVALIALMMILTGCQCKHEWKEATCTEPKICTKCGETEGEPLGHEWKEATCTEPKTCAKCGETEGDPLGHEWKEATCTEQKTCSKCGITEGDSLGHDWQDATYSAPKTCSRCGKTEGEPLKKAANNSNNPPQYTTDTDQSTSNDGEIYVLAEKAKNKLRSVLKNPESLQIHAVYGGTRTEYDGTPDGMAVLIDYSAMNGFDGYNRAYFRVWGNAYGNIAYESTSYWPYRFFTDSYEL